MKKILILAPFKNFGGREIHINLIAKCLSSFYEVHILSTSFATNNSFAFQDIISDNCHIINDEILKINKVLKFLTKLSYLKSNKENEFHSYLHNTFTKRIFNLKSVKEKFLEKFIDNFDLIIMPVILNEPFVKFTIDFAKKNQTPVLIQTVTTVNDKMVKENPSLSKVSHFIHHSQFNANKLNSLLKHKYTIIDQSIVAEKKITSLPIETNSNLTYGYLGRLEKGKNILALIDFFKKNRNHFLIAGKGTELNTILYEIKNLDNCEYIGIFNPSNLADFYKKIDVIIIASSEEGGPFIGLEAMAAGKLIISTRVGAMEERLNGTKNSLWIEVDNIEKSLNLVFKKINTFDQEEINIIKNINREKYLKHYSFEIMQMKYKKLIETFN
ncbi:MAG: glycosyltransferase family 4 protein [Flavobacteriaceae bacterium]